MTINATTKMLGVLGYPIGHSLSPVMHNKALAYLNLNYCYLPLPLRPEDMQRGVEGLRALGFVGFNVTIPHKETVMSFLDQVDREAHLMGAVNTVVHRKGKLIGYNTDGQGFLRSVSELWGYSPQGQAAVILGAGGAARAIAAALVAKGLRRLTIVNRDIARATKLVSELQTCLPCEYLAVGLESEELDFALAGASLVVQTSPVGMYPQNTGETIINPKRLYKHNRVYDIIFNPGETQFLAGARAVGCKTANGLGMLLHQGALAFELWTGMPAPVEIMRQALVENTGG